MKKIILITLGVTALIVAACSQQAPFEPRVVDCFEDGDLKCNFAESTGIPNSWAFISPYTSGINTATETIENVRLHNAPAHAGSRALKLHYEVDSVPCRDGENAVNIISVPLYSNFLLKSGHNFLGAEKCKFLIKAEGNIPATVKIGASATLYSESLGGIFFGSVDYPYYLSNGAGSWNEVVREYTGGWADTSFYDGFENDVLRNATMMQIYIILLNDSHFSGEVDVYIDDVILDEY